MKLFILSALALIASGCATLQTPLEEFGNCLKDQLQATLGELTQSVVHDLLAQKPLTDIARDNLLNDNEFKILLRAAKACKPQ